MSVWRFHWYKYVGVALTSGVWVIHPEGINLSSQHVQCESIFKKVQANHIIFKKYKKITWSYQVKKHSHLASMNVNSQMQFLQVELQHRTQYSVQSNYSRSSSEHYTKKATQKDNTLSSSINVIAVSFQSASLKLQSSKEMKYSEWKDSI